MHFSLSRRRYIEEQIQREGVAMETSGFTFVTSGKKKKTLTGPATMVAFPHFRPLSDNAAVMSVLIASARSSRLLPGGSPFRHHLLTSAVSSPSALDPQ